MNKIISTWIIFHGITDLFLPIKQWMPFYLLSPVYAILPKRLLYTTTFLKSIIHFYNDRIFDIKTITFGLFLLLYYGKYRLSQYIILIYMSLIHVPIHFYRIELSDSQILFLILIYIYFYKIQYLHNKIDKIIKNGGIIDNNIDKLLLGVINSHILCNFCKNCHIY